jgi:hypothetical protein
VAVVLAGLIFGAFALGFLCASVLSSSREADRCAECLKEGRDNEQ